MRCSASFVLNPLAGLTGASDAAPEVVIDSDEMSDSDSDDDDKKKKKKKVGVSDLLESDDDDGDMHPWWAFWRKTDPCGPQPHNAMPLQPPPLHNPRIGLHLRLTRHGSSQSCRT